MTNQLFYENIEVGSELPCLRKHPTVVQLVRWAGAIDDYSAYNFDKEYALSIGLPGVIVTGSLIISFLTQLITDWIGEEGSIKKLACSLRGIYHPYESIICKGRVTNKYVNDGQGYVECEIWAQTDAGKRSTGIVIIVLPRDSKSATSYS